MAALSGAAGAAGGLAAKRAAAEQLMGMGSIAESTAAALAAALGENEAAGERLAQLSESAEKLQVCTPKPFFGSKSPPHLGNFRESACHNEA
jgi:hypothetical protein